MNESSAVLCSSWASTVHSPGPARRGGPLDRGVLVAHACALHPHPAQPDVGDVGMRWATAQYEGIRSYRRRSGHVAA
jgi:hypothetical protein